MKQVNFCILTEITNIQSSQKLQTNIYSKSDLWLLYISSTQRAHTHVHFLVFFQTQKQHFCNIRKYVHNHNQTKKKVY